MAIRKELDEDALITAHKELAFQKKENEKLVSENIAYYW